MTIITPSLLYLGVQNQNFPGGACPQTPYNHGNYTAPLILNPESALDVFQVIALLVTVAHSLLIALKGLKVSNLQSFIHKHKACCEMLDIIIIRAGMDPAFTIQISIHNNGRVPG